MSDTLSLPVELRSVVGKEVKYLRQNGFVPATVYGKQFGPLSIQIDERVFHNVYRKAGRTKLITMEIPEHPQQVVLVQDLQRHPVSRDIIHADFRVVDLTIATVADVPVVLINTSPQVERGNAIMNHSMPRVQVRALPSDIPSQIEADVSVLDSFEKQIQVRDLKVSGNYEIVSSPDGIVATISPTRQARTSG